MSSSSKVARIYSALLLVKRFSRTCMSAGKHKGTPMLKNGIRCVGMDPDDESEQSDWGGFN